MEDRRKRLKVGINNWIDACNIIAEKEKGERIDKIESSRYAAKLKTLWEGEGKHSPVLEKKEGYRKNELKLIERFRLGSETRECQYWKKGKDRRCRLCGEEEESLEHVIVRCRLTGKEGADWKEVVKGEGKNLATLWEIIWKRKRKEAEEEGER